MGSRRNWKRKSGYRNKRAKSQIQRRQKEREKKIKDHMGMQEVMSPPVTKDAVYTKNVISSNNVPLGQQNGMLPITPTFGFPTPTAGIQSNGILVLLNPIPQAVLPRPTILTVPQLNNTILEGVIPAKHKPTPIQNSSPTSNDGVAFEQGSSVTSGSDVTIRKEMPASSKNELDIIKENLISKGTEIRVIESAVPAKTADSHAKRIIVSSKKVGSLSVAEIPLTENDNRVPVKERQRKKCCIIGCGQMRTSNGPSIHAFPKNDDLLTKWFDSIGNRMLPLSFDSMPVICGEHFEQHCFVKSYNRKAFKTLNPGSVPTVFPPHSDATASTTGNDDTRLVYDCQIKVEPADVTEPCVSEYLKASKPTETPSATRVSGSETVDWNFSLKDMECPEKAKLYFLKVQNEIALQKLQQKQPAAQSQPQTVQVKEEIVIDSGDEQDGEPERKQQKMKPGSTNFQQEKWKVTGDKPEQDEFDAYAVTVAAKLRKMDLKQRMFAENMINHVLYKGLMNQLSAVTQTTGNPPTPPLQSQAMSSCPNVQQSQLQPLFSLNINPPRIQGTFPVQSQPAFQNTLQNSTFSAILPSQTLGQFSTHTFPAGPISNFGLWTPGSSAI